MEILKASFMSLTLLLLLGCTGEADVAPENRPPKGSEAEYLVELGDDQTGDAASTEGELLKFSVPALFCDQDMAAEVGIQINHPDGNRSYDIYVSDGTAEPKLFARASNNEVSKTGPWARRTTVFTVYVNGELQPIATATACK